MGSGFFDHAVDFALIKARRRFDGNLLFFACAEVFSRNVYDTVGINVKGYFNTRYSARSSRNACQFKAAQGFVVSSHFTFALEDMNVNRRLVIYSCREYLAAGCRNRRVAVDNLSEDAAECFNTQGQRCNIEEQYVFDIAYENAGLDSSTDSNAFIRVDAFARFFAQNLFNGFLNSRDTAGTADEDDFINFIDGETGISNRFFRRFHRSMYQIFC